MKTIDPKPARKLTTRECCKIIGSLIGGLTGMADVEDVRSAMEWWAGNDKLWEMMKIVDRRAYAEAENIISDDFCKSKDDGDGKVQ